MSKNYENQGINKKEEMLCKYFKLLEDSCNDFKKIKFSYEKAYKELQKIFTYIEEIAQCNNEIVLLNLELSFEQGLKDNIFHFENPKAPTFLEEEYGDILNEKALKNRIEYIEASGKRRALVGLLPLKALKLYDICIEYYTFVDTYIPKIAHYYGFITGNSILQKSIKDYEPDIIFSESYKKWLNDYLNLKL